MNAKELKLVKGTGLIVTTLDIASTRHCFYQHLSLTAFHLLPTTQPRRSKCFFVEFCLAHSIFGRERKTSWQTGTPPFHAGRRCPCLDIVHPYFGPNTVLHCAHGTPHGRQPPQQQQQQCPTIFFLLASVSSPGVPALLSPHQCRVSFVTVGRRVQRPLGGGRALFEQFVRMRPNWPQLEVTTVSTTKRQT